MKKILVLGMVAGLTACQPLSALQNFTATEATKSYEVYEEEGKKYINAKLGDVVETAFFEFSVDSVRRESEYHGLTPSEGKEFIVVDMSIENLLTSSIPMSDFDFQIQWGDEADDAYAYPITAEDAGLIVSDEQFPNEYELGISEEKNGELIYEVPTGYKDFSVSYQEYFADDSEGDVYFIYFTVQ